MNAEQVLVPKTRECCAEEANLRVIESTMTRTIRECQVCGAKHHELLADIGDLRAKIAPAG